MLGGMGLVNPYRAQKLGVWSALLSAMGAMGPTVLMSGGGPGSF
jgi:hypothetical protein